jgi:hypothetical protein
MPPTSSSTYHLTTDLHHTNLDGATVAHTPNFCIIHPTKEVQKASNKEGNPHLYCYCLFSFFLFPFLPSPLETQLGLMLRLWHKLMKVRLSVRQSPLAALTLIVDPSHLMRLKHFFNSC